MDSQTNLDEIVKKEQKEKIIFTTSEIERMRRRDLISALLENDEELAEAELISKTNDELKDELVETNQVIKLIQEKKNNRIDAEMINNNVLKCDPTVSGDCAKNQKQKFDFFENNLAPNGETRQISNSEIDIKKLKSRIGQINTIKKIQDTNLRSVLRAVLKNEKTTTFNPKISNVTLNFEAKLTNFCINAVFVKNIDDNLIYEKLLNFLKMGDLSTITNVSVGTAALLSAVKDATPAFKCAENDSENFSMFFKEVNIRIDSSIFQFFKKNCIFKHCENFDKKNCEYFCDLFKNSPILSICALQKMIRKNNNENDNENSNLIRKLLIMMFLFIDIESLETKCENDCIVKIKNTIEAFNIYIQRNTNNKNAYIRAIVFISCFFIIIFKYTNNDIDTCLEFLELCQKIRSEVVNSNIDSQLKETVANFVNEIEYSFIFNLRSDESNKNSLLNWKDVLDSADEKFKNTNLFKLLSIALLFGTAANTLSNQESRNFIKNIFSNNMTNCTMKYTDIASFVGTNVEEIKKNINFLNEKISELFPEISSKEEVVVVAE